MSEHNFQANIYADQVKLLHKNLLVSIPANLICAFVVFLGVHQANEAGQMILWFAAVTVVSIFRLAALFAYYHNPKNTSFNLSIFITGVSLSAALWGVADSLLMPKNSLLEQMIIIVIIAGVTAGGMQTLNASLKASLIYISLIIAPLCVWLLSQGGMTYLTLGAAFITYLIFMLVTAIRGCELLKTTMRLQYQNLQLIEDLSESNKKILLSYKVLEKHESDVLYINKMNDMLQACKKVREAYPAIRFTAKALFSNLNGALAMFNSSTNQLEAVTQWGDEDLVVTPFFAEKQCYGLSKGYNYLVNQFESEKICDHFLKKPTTSICLPLIMQDDLIGLLVFSNLNHEEITKYQQQLATSFCEVIRLSLANIKLRETLYEQAIHDPLTGLFNRRYLNETLSRELKRVKRDASSLCVAMLDLDYFKNFNDANGHEAGDVVLKSVAAILKENFRGGDLACRYGGEEFLIVLVDTTLSAAHFRLECIREVIKQNDIYFNNHLLPTITISIGVAEAPRQATTEKDIIQEADRALYVAKQAGRDRVECFGTMATNQSS